jgi:LPXTG-motif cell wall-anchored protein
MHLAQNRRWMRLIAATAAAALIGLAFSATPAHADPAPTGTLTWGFKEAFRNYLAGQGGTVTSVAPATGTGVVSFPSVSIDDNGGTFSGGIKFLYDLHGINITLSNPEIQITGENAGKLIVDLIQGTTTTADVHFADLTITADEAGTVTFSAVMAEGGVAAFRSYPKGTALDSITVSLDDPSPNPSASSSASGTPAPGTPTPTATTPGEELPTTGSNTTLHIGIGVLLVAAGAGAVLIARRRRDETA